MCGHAFPPQRLKDLNHLAPGADHADVAGASLHRPAQDAHVVTMPSSNDDNIGSLVRIKFLNSLIKIQSIHFTGRWEPLFGSVGGAIIRDNDLEARISRNLTKIDCNMACTENIK